MSNNHLDIIVTEITRIVRNMPADEVVGFNYYYEEVAGPEYIVDYIIDRINSSIKLGNNRSTSNDKVRQEINYVSNNTTECCGILCLDVTGLGVDFYITDLNGNRVSKKRTIYWCNRNNENDRMKKRFSGWGE